MASKQTDQRTFHQRVDDFWHWFPTVAEQAHTELSEGNVEGILAHFPEEMEKLLPQLSWVFGPGKDNGHSFTLTGEGQRAKQMLTAYWHERSVDVPGWTFYASRQPSPRDLNEGAAIDLGGTALNLDEMMVSVRADVEAERADLVAWHPLFDKIDEDGRWQILFLFLDEVLGEFGTQTWVGEIAFGESEDAIALIDLPAQLNRLQDEYDWEKNSPLEEYTGYQAAEPSTGFPRSDVIAGYTLYPNLVFEYANNGGPVDEDPLAGTGAELVFLTIDSSVLPEDDPLGGRERIEEALADNLEDSARFWGGATGIEASYLDLLLFDGNVARAKIQRTLQELGIDSGCRLQRFSV